MKALKSHIARQFAISGSITLFVLLLLCLPILEGPRDAIGSAIGLSGDSLWLLGLVAIAATQLFFYFSSIRRSASPFSRLVQAAEKNDTEILSHLRPLSREENLLAKHVEKRNRSVIELEQSVADLKADLDRAMEKQVALASDHAKSSGQRDELNEKYTELLRDHEAAKAARSALEHTLETERRSKVGLEVEKRTEEIYQQMEKAVAAAAYKAIWIPSLVHELRSPITEIRTLSNRLKTSWTDSSIQRVSEEIGRIASLAESQLSLLDEIIARQPSPADLEQPAPTKVEEPPAIEVVTPEADEPLQEKPLFSDFDEFTPPDRQEKPTLSLKKEEPDAIELEIEPPAEPQADPQPFEVETETPLTPEPEPVITTAEPKDESLPDFAKGAEMLIGRAAGKSPYQESSQSLANVMRTIVEQAAESAPHAYITYQVDESLDIEIEDEQLPELMRSMLEAATRQLSDGEAVLSATLEPDLLAIDVTCDGRLHSDDRLSIGAASGLARILGGELDVDHHGTTELRLSFDYRFDIQN